MTNPQSGHYDWGAPAQTPAPAQPAAKPERSGALKPILAVLGVVLLLLAGLWVFQKVRPAPVGPLGWDEATLESKLDAGQIRDCNLGADFYDSVGIRNVENCTGTITTAEGYEIRASIYTEQGPNGETTSPSDPELIGWKQSADAGTYVPETLDALVDQTTGSGTRCQMASSKPMLEKVWMMVDGPCEALYPAARQLSNLQTQYDWQRTDHGMFDFSRPDYLEVSPATPSVEAAVYKQGKDEAKPLGEPLAVVDPNNEGSVFAVTGGEVFYGDRPADGSKVCIDATFTLGREISDSSRFRMPSTYVAVFPGGQRVDLDREQSRVRLKQGETADDLRYCGNFVAELKSDEFVAFADDKNGDYATWLVQTTAGGTEGA